MMGLSVTTLQIIDIINFNDPVPLAPLPQNDNQNVHDSTIQTHIINCVNKLKEDKYKGKLHLTNDELINEIKHFIFTSYNGANKIKENALNTLNKMLKINGNIAKLNMSENEILKLVWNRIHNPINKQREQIIKENGKDNEQVKKNINDGYKIIQEIEGTIRWDGVSFINEM